jgi:hypothetical protein
MGFVVVPNLSGVTTHGHRSQLWHARAAARLAFHQHVPCVALRACLNHFTGPAFPPFDFLKSDPANFGVVCGQKTLP